MLLFTTILSILIMLLIFNTRGRIYWGIKVIGIDIEGQTVEEARVKLQPVITLVENRKVDLIVGSKHWFISPKELGVRVNLKRTLHSAYSSGRIGSFAERGKEIYRLIDIGKNLPLMLDVNEARLNQVLQDIGRDVNIDPENVELMFSESTATVIKPSSLGGKLLIEEAKSKIKGGIAKGINKMELVVQPVQPKLSERVVNRFGNLDIMARFSTEFDETDINRTNNVVQAAENLHGYVMNAGETFSFNQAVGHRGIEEGYKEAKVIIDRKFVMDVGGGVCQVSTTLYNAALLADMSIVERTEHSRPVKYIPPGRGATVAYGLIDLKIRNPMDAPVLILSTINRGKLTVYLLGEKLVGKEVTIESTDYSQIDPKVIEKERSSIPKGQQVLEVQGSHGFQVTTWREVKQDGEIIRRELLSKDRIEPEDTIILIGNEELKGSPD